MNTFKAPWGVNDDGDVADESGELVAIDPRTGTFPSSLIAAAPELYAVCEMIANGASARMIREPLIAALAKARGQ